MNERVSIEQASAGDLRAFASITFGLELNGTENKLTMISKLKTVGYDLDDIPLIGDLTPGPAPVSSDGKMPTIKNDKGEECCKILIQVEDKDGGDEPVPVGVNGVLMYIPRGEPVLVPVAYVEVLNNAVQLIYEPTESGLKAPRQVTSYPHSLVA